MCWMICWPGIRTSWFPGQCFFRSVLLFFAVFAFILSQKASGGKDCSAGGLRAALADFVRQQSIEALRTEDEKPVALPVVHGDGKHRKAQHPFPGKIPDVPVFHFEIPEPGRNRHFPCLECDAVLTGHYAAAENPSAAKARDKNLFHFSSAYLLLVSAGPADFTVSADAPVVGISAAEPSNLMKRGGTHRISLNKLYHMTASGAHLPICNENQGKDDEP